MSQTAAPIVHYISGYVQEGKIYSQSYESGLQQVGVTNQLYNELQKQHEKLIEISDGYQKRLIELGEIEIPLTQEQLIERQAKQLDESREIMLKLAAKIELLTAEKETHHECLCQSVSRDSGEESEIVIDDAPSISSRPKNTAKPSRNTQFLKSKQR